MGLLNLLDRLERLKPNAFTIWSTTQDGYRYQANIQLKRGGAWHVKLGDSMEEAMSEAMEGCFRGDRTYDDVPATRARDAIRAAADPDDDPDPPRRPQPQARKRTDLFDDAPRGGQQRKRS